MNQAVACRALLVGYRNVSREVLRRLLRACDCEAVVADDAAAAAEELDAVDRVFLDLTRGDEDGGDEGTTRDAVALLRRIHREALPVKVAVTVRRGAPVPAAVARRRPDAVFAEPIDFIRLSAWMKE